MQADYLLASAYLAQQRPDEALSVYKRIMEVFPQEAQPHYNSAMVLLAQRRLPEARQELERTIELSPDYLPAIEGLADLDIADQHYDTAIARVQQLIDKEPKQAQSWAIRGKIHLAQRDFTAAESDLLKAIDLNANLEPAYLLLANVYVASNRQDEAIQRLTSFTDKNKDAPALLQLALLHQQLGHFATARSTYEKLLTVAPNSLVALNNLAVLYSEQFAEPNKAYELAKKAAEMAPNEPHTADTLGWVAFKKGAYAEAQRLLQQSAARLPDDPEIAFHLGMAEYMLGQDEAARTALQKVTNAPANFLGKDEARKRLAVLAISSDVANPAARAELENYLRERPNDPAALVRLAALQQRGGEADQAIKTYEKVLADNGQYLPAARQLALIYSRQANPDPKAYELAAKVLQAHPDDPQVAKAFGILNYRRGFYAQSAELLKEAATKDDPEALFFLAQTNRELKQWTACKGALEKALALRLPSDLADEAKRALADCADNAP